jgi:DNA modification methylase
MKDLGDIVLEGARYFLKCAESLDFLRSLPSNSIDSIITDPPYGLKFIKGWKYDVPSVALWEECERVAKPGAHLLSFSGTRTYHRICVNIEDGDFEIRDQLLWVYGSGFPKSKNIGKALEGGEWDGWGTGLKPSFEPIIMARKKVINTVTENVSIYGTGGLNIDACRVGDGSDKTPGGCKGSNRLHDGGITKRSPVDFTKGRWPGNLMHDGSPEVVSEFPGKDKKSKSRFFYCPKASKKDRTMSGEVENDHPTVKPSALMRYLCRLITPPNGIILDPFSGSGSTGCAALLEGFRFIGCDIKEEYVNIARERIGKAL